MYSNDLMGMAVSYIFIIIAGLVATFLYDACAGGTQGTGRYSYAACMVYHGDTALVKIYTMPVLRKQGHGI